MGLEDQILEIKKQLEEEKRLNDKRALQFYAFVNANQYSSFFKAIDIIDSDRVTLLISKQENVTDDKTVPANVTLKPLQGGTLNIPAGKTLTINGHVEAGLYQWIEGDGSVVFNLQNSIQAIWFPGANIGAKINAAFTALAEGGTVNVHNGNFAYTTDIYVPRNSKIYYLKGAGYTSSILNYTGTGTALDAYVGDAHTVNINLCDLTVFGSVAAACGVNISATQFSSLSNIKIQGFSGAMVKGLLLQAATQGGQHTFNVYNSHFLNNSVNVGIENYNNVNFYGGSIEGGLKYNLAINGSIKVNFFGGLIEGLAVGGFNSIYIYGGSRRVRFYSVWIEENHDIQYPIYLDSSDANFYDCIFDMYDTNDLAKVISLWTAGTDVIQVRNCIFSGYVTHPILKTTHTVLSGKWFVEENCSYSNVTNSFPSILEGSLVWDPGNLVDGAGETSGNITVAGVAVTDTVIVYPPYSTQGILCQGYVSAVNTVNIRLQNETGGAIDLASGTWRVKVFRY